MLPSVYLYRGLNRSYGVYLMAKDYTGNFYTSKAWLSCRTSFISKRVAIDGGQCERCDKAGKIVHHKKYITPMNINDPYITLNHDNLEYLCDYCHKKEHGQAFDTVQEGLRFNSKGELEEC